MPKSKHGPSLFDLLTDPGSEAPETLKLQTRRLRGEHEPSPPPSGPVSEVPSTGRLKIADPPEPGPDKHVRLLGFDGGRVRVSLTSKTAAVAFFVAVVLLVVAFEVGARSGHAKGLRIGYQEGRASYAAEAISEIEVARNQPPSTHMVSALLATPEATAARPEAGVDKDPPDPGKPPWIRGYTYIVAQEFSAESAGNAAKAQAFLADHGIVVAQVPYPSGAVQLIATQGYNHRDPTQKRMAEEFLKKLHAVGSKYYAGGGGYKLEGYFKTLKSDRW